MSEKPRLNPAELAGSLMTKIKGREAKKEVKNNKKDIENQIASLNQFLDYLGSDANEKEELSVLDLKKQAGFLQDFFGQEFTPEINDLIKNVPEIDEKDLKVAEKTLSEHADAVGLSIEQLLEELSKDEDEEIRKQAEMLKQSLEAKNKISFLKEKLIAWALSAVNGLKENAVTELQMSEEQLAELDAKYKKLEMPENAYPEYAEEMKKRFVAIQTYEDLYDRELKRRKENCEQTEDKVFNQAKHGRLTYRDDNGEWRMVNSQYEYDILRSSNKEALEDFKRRKKVNEVLWQDFFEYFKQVVEQKFPDEAKRKNFLERLVGVTEPKIVMSKEVAPGYGINLDEKIFRELGEETKLVVIKHLETAMLANLHGTTHKDDNYQKSRIINNGHNVELVTNFLFWKKQITDKELDGLSAGRSVYFSSFTKRGENEKVRHELVQEMLNLLKNNPEIVNKVESVLRAMGYDRISSSPFVVGDANSSSSRIVLLGGSEPMPLQVRDGIFFESPDSLGERQKEAAVFEQRLADAINAGKVKREKRVITREDALSVANAAVESARREEIKTEQIRRANEENTALEIERAKTAAEREAGKLVTEVREETENLVRAAKLKLAQVEKKLGIVEYDAKVAADEAAEKERGYKAKIESALEENEDLVKDLEKSKKALDTIKELVFGAKGGVFDGNLAGTIEAIKKIVS